ATCLTAAVYGSENGAKDVFGDKPFVERHLLASCKDISDALDYLRYVHLRFYSWTGVDHASNVSKQRLAAHIFINNAFSILESMVGSDAGQTTDYIGTHQDRMAIKNAADGLQYAKHFLEGYFCPKSTTAIATIASVSRLRQVMHYMWNLAERCDPNPPSAAE